MKTTPLLIFNSLLVHQAIKIFLSLKPNYSHIKIYEVNKWNKIEFYRNPYLNLIFYLNSSFDENFDEILECEIWLGKYTFKINLNKFYIYNPMFYDEICHKNSELILKLENTNYLKSNEIKQAHDEIIINSLFCEILNLILINCPDHIYYSLNEITLKLDQNKIIKYIKFNKNIQCHFIYDNQIVFKVVLNDEIKEILSYGSLKKLFINFFN